MARELSHTEKKLQSTRDRLMANSDAVIKVNNVEVTVGEYMKDPAKYNSAPLDPKYLAEVEADHKVSVATNNKLSFDRNSIRSII